MPSPHHSDGERVERWEVLTIARGRPHTQQSQVRERVVFNPKHWVESESYDTETYHPESAPNVLSPEEAQLLVDQLDFWVESQPGSPVAELKQRLVDYGKEHHAER